MSEGRVQLSDTNVQTLRERLEHTCRSVGIDPTGLFDLLAGRYEEPHRHYHRLAHLEHCFAVLDTMLAWYGCGPRPAVELALWFHDVIYDPRARDNEARSAELAGTELTERGADRELVEQVVALINLTAGHAGPGTVSGPDDLTFDDALVCDCDLAVLGGSEREYEQYRDGVRAEYAFVNDEQWSAGRRAVLESLIGGKTSLYSTTPMAAREAAARANLERELRDLE